MSFAVLIHALCALAYVAVAGVLLRHGADRALKPRLLAGIAAVVLWAAAAAARDAAVGAGVDPLAAASAANALQALEMLLWLAVAAGLLRRRGDLPRWTAAAAAGSVALAGMVALPPVLWVAGWASGGMILPIAGGLGLALLGLVLIENVARGAAPGGFWSVKFLAIGLGGIFVYDFFLYSDALLFRQLDVDLLQARGAVHLILAPVLALGATRRPNMRPLSVSHSMAFHTAALLGAGCYLVLMGAAGLYVREFGGRWGLVLQVGFLFASVVLLAVLVGSGRIRAHARVLVAKHFFAYKYDYRVEWLRFIAALSEGGMETDARRRVVGAVANIVDSPGGALWLRDEHGAHHLVATLNQPRAALPERLEPELAAFLDQQRWILVVDEWRARGERYGELTLPAWVEAAPVWLLVPLAREDGLSGVLALQPPRAPRKLDWEDFDLLRTLASEAASRLSEHEAMQALADARQLELFNRRFAFVVHDLKTIISQMSLVLKNADAHAGNPAFQRDLVVSVAESVDSMNALLAQINAERGRADRVELVGLARALIERLPDGAPVALDAAVASLDAAGDERRLKMILTHLVKNAREAAGPAGRVTVRIGAEAGRGLVEVVDDGPGMDAAFVRDKLFRPFASTKDGGFGIGAYQCRELVRELGGQLVVDSTPGRGTTFRVLLPLITPAQPPADSPKQRKVV